MKDVAEGKLIALEPQVLLLLQLLIENWNRMVSKAELVEHIWQRRAISDAAIASRVKLARNAIGDDGDRSGRPLYGDPRQ